jgi:transposase-like protein
VVLVLTLLAHGCPLQAIVVAFRFDERTVAAWWARAGHQGQAVQEHLVEQPRELGHVQADDLRVKTQGGTVWMALAMMVKTRLWLVGEVSAQRDMPLIRRLIERVRRGAARRPRLMCTDGLVSYLRAIRETFRDSVYTGKGGRPRLRPWHNILIAQVVKRYKRRRVVETERRIIAGTPARVETLRRRSQGDGVINTAYITTQHGQIRFFQITHVMTVIADEANKFLYRDRMLFLGFQFIVGIVQKGVPCAPLKQGDIVLYLDRRAVLDDFPLGRLTGFPYQPSLRLT